MVAALSPPVTIVGAGIAGASCAVALRRAGIDARVVDRGRAPGGRLAAPTLHGRRVDLGAAYFTVSDDDFATVVADWARRGMVRPWTNTLDAFSATGHETKPGSTRYAAPGGLRSLVRDLLTDIGAEQETEITALGDVAGSVVLAMPDPQAARLIDAPPGVGWVDYDPVIAVALGYPSREWGIADAAFVNDDPAITLVADDGARRGDGAPVLVVHTTAELARAHLGAPEQVVEPVQSALQRNLGLVSAPLWSHTQRWTFAKPAGTHGDASFALQRRGDGWLGICGDAWCPSGPPRVESAWRSGRALAAKLAGRLS